MIDEDLHMAWQAHAEDNAPGVERALARLEAVMIQLNGTVSNEPVVDLAEGDSPRRPARKANGQITLRNEFSTDLVTFRLLI